MAKLYDPYQRISQEIAKAASPPQSRNENRSKTRRISLTTDKKIADDEFMAAALGDTEWLRQSLRGSKGQVNFDKNGLAPIHLAAIHGRLDSLKLLIEKLKVDVNLPSSTGWRPVHLVISSQNGKRAFTCLQYLLRAGAHHSVCNDDGVTPVHQAAAEGHVPCLKSLIDAGAAIETVDVRNHKPIDLAKLWGHRKCARILATESWHREKDNVAKEMKQLEKLKMQHVLQEIEQEEQQLAHQQFYGDIAFNQWMGSKGLQTGQQRAQSRGSEVKSKRASQRGSQKGDQVMVPNSKRMAKDEMPPGRRRMESAEPAIVEEVVDSRGGTPKEGIHKPLNMYPLPPEEDMETDQDQAQDPQEPTKDATGPPRWNVSTHIPPKTYTTNLSDYYPRDEYTMLPKYPLKKGDPVKVQVPLPEKSSAMSSASSRRPNLPEEVIQKALSPAAERPVMYKPIAIMDVHKRKHYSDEEKLYKSEAGIHLTNDFTSRLFKSALLQPHRQSTASTSDSSSTVVSSVSKDLSSAGATTDLLSLDVPGVVKLMKRMSDPVQYPRIQGKEYVLNNKQAAAI